MARIAALVLLLGVLGAASSAATAAPAADVPATVEELTEVPATVVEEQPEHKPVEVLLPEAAPQANGLLLPTGGGMIGAMPFAAATDPLSARPLLPGAPLVAGPLPGLPAGPLPGLPGAFPAGPGALPGVNPAFGGAPLLPGFPGAGPLMPAPLPALPPALPTSLPGDGMMGRGGATVIPGVTPGASRSAEMDSTSVFASTTGGGLGMGSSLGDPFSGGISASSTLGASGGSGTLGGAGAGAGAGSDSPLRNRRATMNGADSAPMAKGLAGALLLLVAALVA